MILTDYATDLLFPAPPPTYTEETPGFVNIGNGCRTAALAINLEQAKCVILHCHGNGEDAHEVAELMRKMLPQEYGMIIPDYAGYGLSDGEKSEEGCVAAAKAAYDWLVDAKGFSSCDIVISGFSLGTGIAVALAAHCKVNGIALFAPFFNGRSLIEGWVGKSTTDAILGKESPFPSDKILKTLEVPIAVAHGKHDEVIPIECGRKIYKCARKPFGFHVVESGHNDLFIRLGMEGFSAVMQSLVGDV